MADITKELKAFKDAVYGEDMRDGLISSVTKMNAESEDNKQKVAEYGKKEAAIIAAENSRVSNENDRKSAETGRASAESTRVTNENARKSAEAARVTAESSRVSAENTRVSQENSRKTAETGRPNAEKSRVTAEAGRVSAETKRVEEFAKIKSEHAESIKTAADAAGRADNVADELRKKLENGDFQGQSGVCTSLAPGIFGMYVNQEGHLILRHNDNEPEPPLSIQDGKLLYTIS